jgi:glycosyltransferase domain-containing protein
MSPSFSEQVSLLVPTLNRSEFLIRLLHYYVDTAFKGWLVIGDSSDDHHAERTARAIRALNGALKVTHGRYPALNEPRTTRQLLGLVTTPYVAFMPDDDFVVPASMARCVEFLERHPDYSLVHGRAVMVMLQHNGAYGPVEDLWPHYWTEECGSTATERLRNFLGSKYFASLFSVHRTAQLRAIYCRGNVVPVLPDKVFMEVLAGCLAVIQGKAKRLDCLYIVRHHHDQRYLVADLYDWITGPDWFPAYEGFRNCVVEELARQDRISVEEAREVVKSAFWPWLASRLMSHWQKRQTLNGDHRRWREIARRLPGLKTAWRTLRTMLPGTAGAVSLPALLRPSSPYHQDFMPIFRAVTTSDRVERDDL